MENIEIKEHDLIADIPIKKDENGNWLSDFSTPITLENIVQSMKHNIHNLGGGKYRILVVAED